jgi:hypothetical protein
MDASDVQRAISAPTNASWRTAKSCGPDLPTLGSSSEEFSRSDGGKKARFTEESTNISR